MNKIFFFLLSFFFVLVTPVFAQQPTVDLPNFSLYNVPVLSPFDIEEQIAPVILDGRELFQVGSFVNGENSLTASRRAAEINRKLEEAISSNIHPQLEVRNTNSLPTIFLNDSYLFTVTSKEANEGQSLAQTAIDLQETIEDSIVRAQQERSQEYRYRQYIIAVVVIAIAILLDRILTLLRTYSLDRVWRFIIPFQATSTNSQELSLLSKIRIGLARILLWLITAYLITDLFPITRSLRYEIINSFWNALNAPLFSLGEQSYSIVSILILLGLFWGLITAIRTFTKFFRTRILHRTGMSRGSQEVIFIITQYGLIFIGTIILLQIWGLNLSSLTILGSALGVGIGFGFQDIAKNFASGLVLLFERSVQVGDFIEVNNYKGTVERVGARSIVLRTLDRVSIIVPNSSLLADEVVNWTHEGSISRLHLPVGLAYGSNTDTVKSVLLQAAASHAEVLRHPAPQVVFKGFGDSSLDFEVLIWITEPSHQMFIISDLYFKIEQLLRDRNLEIPFPHRDIQFRDPNLSLGLSKDVENALLHWLQNHNHQRINHKD